MPWRPSFPGERPTLGWGVLEWITENLAQPETQEYRPLVFTREQAEFVLKFYELDPVSGRRLVQRGVLSRPRGWGKSPMTAALAIVEGLGPVVPDGWDADGQPVAQPWSLTRRPLVEIAAVSEDQVNTNTWAPLLDIFEGPVLDNYPGIEPMQGFVNLPYGRIQKRTAEARSAKGAPAVFVVCDQVESWTPGNGGVALHQTLRNNVLKRGGHMLESPNAYTPGEQSVAESSMSSYQMMVEGKVRGDRSIYYDHREAPADTDFTDHDSLLHGLTVAYGDSAEVSKCAIHDPPCRNPGWVDLEHIIGGIWQPDADIQVSRADFGNQITHATDSWLSQPVWKACEDQSKTIIEFDRIVLGFDGSRGRAKGKPDATALIGCRVSDGHLFEIGVWEAGNIPSHGDKDRRADCNCWQCWEPPIILIEAAIHDAFQKYRVNAFYADPGKDWRSHINAWEARWGHRVEFKATANHPFEWWMTGGRSSLVERAVLQLEGAVRNQDITHPGSLTLTRHVLNARRRLSHGKLALAKENDYSPNKIDAAVAAVLAYQARLDALSRVVEEPSTFYVPSKLY